MLHKTQTLVNSSLRIHCESKTTPL